MQHFREVKFGSPEWDAMVATVAARPDIRHVFSDLSIEDIAVKQWVLEGKVLRELEIELPPYERMKLQGALLTIFFPQGIPRTWVSGSGGT
jgi:hypothetical protein